MVGQVKIVAILMLVQGGLVTLMSLFTIARGLLFMFGVMGTNVNVPQNAEVSAGTIAAIGGGAALCIGVLALVSGALDIFAGLKAMKFQSRTLVLVALFCNILPIFTCYCIPTSIGVMIYGLIVMFNAQVAEAFQLGDQGQTPEAILARFQPPPPPPPA